MLENILWNIVIYSPYLVVFASGIFILFCIGKGEISLKELRVSGLFLIWVLVTVGFSEWIGQTFNQLLHISADGVGGVVAVGIIIISAYVLWKVESKKNAVASRLAQLERELREAEKGRDMYEKLYSKLLDRIEKEGRE